MERIIFAYTRQQAIRDRLLIDVTETAKEAGFSVPVALTHAVWAQCVKVPDGVTGQDEAGRLWDVMWMCRVADRRRLSDTHFFYQLFVKNDNRPGEGTQVTLKVVYGPDDEGEACLTIMLPDED